MLDENIQKLISSNIQQTDQIIDRVMKRNVEDIKNREITSNSRISQKSSNNMTDEQLVNAISELLKNEKQEKINKLNCHARSYYFVITIRSVCIDYLRKNKIKSKYLDEYVTEEQVINTNMSEKRHINEFEKSEMYIDLSNALLKMSERDKELLTYRYTMEMSSKEISKITGIKESNVNSYIRRAREKLLKIFNGEV